MYKLKIFALILLGCILPRTALSEEKPFIQLGEYKVHPTRILARFADPGPQTMQRSLRTLQTLGLTIERHVSLVPGLVLLDANDGNLQLLDAGADEEALREALVERIAELRNSGLFQYVEPDYIREITLAPTDAAFVDGRLWGLKNRGLIGADINAEQAWDITTGSRNVIVAVIDTGVRYTHQDLAVNMWRNPGEIPGNAIDDDGDGYVDNVFGINSFSDTGDPMDDNGHGTHVAGTIGALANNGAPHVGVCWTVQIMAIKAAGPAGFFSISGIVTGLDFAVQEGAQISNNSYGGYGFSQAEYDAIAAARAAGHLFVAAAGNDALDNDGGFRAYPASFDLDNIISVAAVNRNDMLANFSNFGLVNVDIGAPGVAIFSTVNDSDNAYATFDGTSMAAPHVAGVAALVLSAHPTAPYQEIRDRILLSAIPIPALAGKVATGGRLNAYEALTIAGDGVIELTVTPPSGSVMLRPSTQEIFVRVSDIFGITNATVTGTISGVTNLVFRNDGTGNDAVADDSLYSAVLQVPADRPEILLTVTATAPGLAGASTTVQYILLTPPPNDNLTNAAKVASSGDIVTANNTFASMEPDEPLHAGVPTVDKSVWWDYSPDRDGTVIFDTTGSFFDTVVAVYTGNVGMTNLVEVAAADDVGELRQGYVLVDVEQGRTYHIAVASVNPDEDGEIRLRVEPGGQPDSTLPLVIISQPLSGSTVFTNRIIVSGTASDPQPNASGVSSVSVKVNDELVGTIANGTTNWAAPVLLADGVNTIEARALDFAGNLSLPARITVTVRQQDAQNDLWATAIKITNFSEPLTGSNVRAGKEFAEPQHAGNEGGRSIWWRFDAPADGVLFLSTQGSTFDTLLGLYTGSRVTNLTTVASSDDAAPGQGYSEITQSVKAGTYWIAVDGFGGASGRVQLSVAFSTSAIHRVALHSGLGGSIRIGSATYSDGFTNQYPAGATVLVEAVADTYYEFDKWVAADDSPVSTDNPLSLQVDGPIELEAVFVPRDFSEGFESGFTLNWEHLGDRSWTIQSASGGGTSNVAFGSGAARSGVIANNQSSRLVLRTELPAGKAAFDYKVSSEPKWDKLEFIAVLNITNAFLTNILVTNVAWSGEVGWDRFEFNLPRSGFYTLEWRYSKDASDPSVKTSLDAAFIDNIELPVGSGAAGGFSLTLSGLSGGSRFIQLQGQPNQNYALERSSDLQTWTRVATQTANASGLAVFEDSSAGSSSVRFYRALIP